ncbi:MAG: hypothetical protein HKM24_03105 [Gammaproteobacteria bacterium]|nr:hypothetical protein [Gammaproteobacteria bacterium]
MELTPDNPTPDRQPNHWISSCGNEGIHIGEQVYPSSIVVQADQVVDWFPNNLTTLQFDTAIQPFLQPDTEIVLLGTGSTIIWPNDEIRSALLHEHIGLEVMTTAAACRTFNILTQDQRNVVAFLTFGK